MDTPPPPPLTIIAVEDNPADVSLIRWVLTAHGLPYTLHVLANADQAMHYINELAQEGCPRSPTLMLLDLHLPQRDGRELLQRVKAIPQGAAIRVVVTTGVPKPTDQAELLGLGADAFFVKPSHLTQFMQLGVIVKDLAFGHGREGTMH